MGTIMLDFRKALDLVDDNLLLNKLDYYSCGYHFIKLMKSYICDRSQVISLKSKMPMKGFVAWSSTRINIRSFIISKLYK